MQQSGSLTGEGQTVTTPDEAIAYFTAATAGHVDHGKTSLIKSLSGVDTDRLKEEKERQMTTDLGYAHLFLAPTLALGFIDVPGHGKFLKNMLAGVGGIDLALLVVAANEGPMPQTRQHLAILKFLGVREIIVVVTKSDLVDQAGIMKTIDEMVALMASHSLKACDFVPVSCVSGKGIHELKEFLNLHLARMPKRNDAGAVFLPIDRAFKKDGFGQVVAGTLVKGKLHTGDQILIQPGGGQARVRRLETFGKVVETAHSGQRVAVNLVLKQDMTLERGQVILGKDMKPAKSVVVSLQTADGARQLRQLSSCPVQFFHGAAALAGRINWLEVLDEEQSERNSGTAIALIALDTPIVSCLQDRFVLRLSDDTIGGGKILVQDKARFLTRQKLMLLAPLLLAGKFREALLQYLQDCPQKMANVDQIAHFIPVNYIADLLSSVPSQEDDLLVIGKWLMSRRQKNLLEDRICASLSEQAQAAGKDASIEPIVSMEKLRTSVLANLDREVFQALLNDLVSQKIINRHGDNLQLPGAAGPSYDSTQALTEKILHILDAVPCLEIAAVASQCQSSEAEMKLLLKKLTQDDKVAVFAREFMASEASLLKAHFVLSKLWQAKHELNPGDFRQALGTSRKYAMALLEYFDNQQITRRLPSGRVLLRACQAANGS